MYIGLEFKETSKENISAVSMFGKEAQEAYSLESFHLADNTLNSFSLINFTGDLVNGHRVTKEVSVCKISKKLTIKVAGKYVKNLVCNIPTTCEDFYVLKDVLKIIRTMSMCKGYAGNKTDISTENWGDSPRVRALKCTGLISSQNRTSLCLKCRKKETYRKSLLEPKVHKEHAEHSYSLFTPIKMPMASVSNIVQTPECMEERDTDADTTLGTDNAYISDSETDLVNDPTYSPSDEDDEEHVSSSATISEENFKLISDLLSVMCPSLANDATDFLILLKSQIANSEKSETRLRRWDPRFKYIEKKPSELLNCLFPNKTVYFLLLMYFFSVK